MWWQATTSQTPQNWGLLEKLMVQLVKKFPALYGTQKFITTFTKACHLSLSWGRPIQSMHHPIPFHEDPFEYCPPTYTYILQVISLLQVSPPNHCMHLSSSLYAIHAPAILFFLIWSPKWHFVRHTDHEALITYSPLVSCYCAFLKPKYLPQHPILKHSYNTFLPQRQGPSVTPN